MAVVQCYIRGYLKNDGRMMLMRGWTVFTGAMFIDNTTFNNQCHSVHSNVIVIAGIQFVLLRQYDSRDSMQYRGFAISASYPDNVCYKRA